MPQPNAHYLVIEESLSRDLESLLQNHANYAGFGSFGPDLFYVKDAVHLGKFARTHPLDYAIVSDIMHWEGSFDFYCSMLDYIKNLDDAEKKDKLKAFAYGYYSHVVADSVFHPFVYRESEDNWRKHNKRSTFHNHKKIESIIDTYLLQERRNTDPYEFNYCGKIVCFNEDDKVLDGDVFALLNHCMAEIYKGGIFTSYSLDYDKFFSMYPNDGNHPINDAYHDFVLYTHELFKWHVPLELTHIIDGLVPLRFLDENQKEKINLQKKRWHNSDNPEMPDYSVPELFDLSVKSMSKIILESEKFFSSNSREAKKFFAENSKNIVYLAENNNLDTGLPSAFNGELAKIADDLGKTFEFGLDKLDEYYKTINAYD